MSQAQTGPRVSYLVGRLDRLLRRRLRDVLGHHGLTLPEYTTLSVLRARGGLSNAQLARRSLITPQSMSEVLSSLLGRGLIARAADPDHGRIIRTELTRAGTAALAACDRAVDELEREMLGALGTQERAGLLTSLAACVRTLEAG
jgi:DNA-binding MarR family transcriptional regulator